MKLKSNVATSENGFIFNPATGDSYTSNEVATRILSMMKNGKTEQEVKLELTAIYEVNLQQLERDWEDWIAQLKEANLIETES